MIKIHQLKVDFRVGYSDQERKTPQTLLFDIEIDLDFRSVHLSDSLEDTINYDDIAEVISNTAKEGSWQMLEKLTYDLSELLLSRFPKIESIKLTVFKNVIDQAQGVSYTYQCIR